MNESTFWEVTLTVEYETGLLATLFTTVHGQNETEAVNRALDNAALSGVEGEIVYYEVITCVEEELTHLH